MAITLFGFELVRRKSEEEIAQTRPSFVTRDDEDGAVVVAPSGGYGTLIDLDGTVRSEAELITKYRDMSLSSEVDAAIDEIVNEAVSVEEEEPVKIIMDNVEATDEVKQAVRLCFSEIVDLMNFVNQCYDIIRRYYVDGRLYYHAIIDLTNPLEGIQELRYIDPRKIRKVREVSRRRLGPQDGSIGPEGSIQVIKNEYYLYNEKGFNYTAGTMQQSIGSVSAQGVKVSVDSIAHVGSGLTDVNGSMVLSYLQKAIKPLNQLRAVEDATVIYRLSRAPERRVWYIDTGTMPKAKAEQYIRDIMVKHKNRLTYDAASGQIQDDRKFMTMLEDYWLARHDGGKGTQVETLPSGQNLGEMDDVLYFQKKLYGALNVPVSRLNPDAGVSIGRATEVGRDEVKFGKFIARFRHRFSGIFLTLLGKQVVLKQIMSIEDWEKIKTKVRFDFAHDNYFMEMKDNEVQMTRMQLLEACLPYVGRYFSNKWITKFVLRQSNEESEDMREEILEEQADPIWSQPMPGQDPMGGMMMGPDVDLPDDEGMAANGEENQAMAMAQQNVPGPPGGPQPMKNGASAGIAQRKKGKGKPGGQAPTGGQG